MGRVEYGRNLMYSIDGMYDGHLIEWATAQHRTFKDRSVGYFRVRRPGVQTIFGVVGEAYKDPADAKTAAIEIAKSVVRGRRMPRPKG